MTKKPDRNRQVGYGNLMAKLVLHGKEGAEREVPLDKQRLTIGRHAENDVCLNDKATSTEHAAVITIGRNSYLQDLESTNGTLVNGAPVHKHTLKHGDVILIGRSHLSYLDESVDTESAAAEKPAVAGLPPSMTFTTPANTAPAKVAPTAKDKVNLESTIEKEPTAYEPWAERTDENEKPKDLVDRAIDAIRSHRDSERTLQLRRRDKLDEEWKKLLEVAESLKKRLNNHPRVQYFDVSRQKSDIMVRIARADNKPGQHTILISRQHPHTPSPVETIWYLESGRPEKHCESAEIITRDLMSTLGPLIS